MQRTEVSIRPLELSDADGVQRYASEEPVARTTSIPHPYPENGGKNFVKAKINAREKRKTFPFAIIADEEMIGIVDLNRANFETREIHVDFGIVSAYWGKGITTKAVSTALSYAFTELQMETVHSGCLANNRGSCRVLEKNGFSKIGEYTLKVPKFKGEISYRFKLTKQEWEQSNSKQ